MKKPLLFTLMLAVFLDIGNFFMPVPVYTPLFLHSPLLQGTPVGTQSILLGILVACYGFAQLFGGPIFGELSDRHGRKKAILFSMVLAIVGCVLGGIGISMGSLPLIFFSRLLVGFASGTVAVVFAAAADNSTEDDRAKNLGYINVGLSVGAILGPVIGGYLVRGDSLFAFSVPFYFMAVLYALNMILLSKILPNQTGFRKSEKKIHLFTAFQNISIVMKRSRYLFFVVLSALFFQIGCESLFLAAPVVAVKKFHMMSPQIGDYFIVFGILAALTSWFINERVNHFFKNPRSIYVACMIGYAATVWFLIAADFNNSRLMFILPFVSIGIFGVLAWVQVNNIFSQAMDETEQGLVFGVSQSMWSMGGMIGTFLVGLSAAVHNTIMVSIPFTFVTLSLIMTLLMVGAFRKKI